MKILITGANGLLGQHLIQQLLIQGHQVFAIGKGLCRVHWKHTEFLSYIDVDIADQRALHTTIDKLESLDYCIHAAAITQVDLCEQDPIACEQVNVFATRYLVTSLENKCKRFIYISTDFVFDGTALFYDEASPTDPVNVYGKSKLAAEKIVAASNLPWSIIRTCLVFGKVISGTRSNIIQWVKESLEASKQISVVSDQFRTPTYISDLVSGILLIMQHDAQGIFHISGEDLLTPYDMAIATANFCGYDTQLIQKVDASNFTQPGKRPLKTGFNIDKAKNILGYKPLTFAQALEKMLGD